MLRYFDLIRHFPYTGLFVDTLQTDNVFSVNGGQQVVTSDSIFVSTCFREQSWFLVLRRPHIDVDTLSDTVYVSPPARLFCV